MMFVVISFVTFIVTSNAVYTTCNSTSQCGWYEFCNNATDPGQCETISCANQGGNQYCWDLGYSSYYFCRDYYDNGNYGCYRAYCNETSDCIDSVGAGTYCNGYSCRGQCDPTSNETICYSWEVCNADTLECEWEDCGNSGGDAYCQREDGPEYVCKTNIYADAYCDRKGCNETADCLSSLGDGFYCDGDYYGECRSFCTNDTACDYNEYCNDSGECARKYCGNQGGDQYCRDQGYEDEYVCYEPNYSWSPEYSYCRQKRCNSTLDCETDIGDGYVCDNNDGYWTGECTEACKNDTYCADRYGDSSYLCQSDGLCDQASCSSTAECSAIDPLLICVWDRCERGCFGNTTYCSYRYGYFDEDSVCTSEGICGRQECSNMDDCPDGYGCEPWNSYSSDGYCVKGCSGNDDCYYKHWDERYECNLATSLCEFTCDSTSECQDWFDSNYECTNNECVEIPYCIYQDDICDVYSESYGYELACNATTGYCDPTPCFEDKDCDTDPFSTCFSSYAIYGIIDEPGYCIDPCTSDQECQSRSIYYDASNYYCMINYGICSWGDSCDTVDDCWSDEVCDNGICKPFFCESDEECVDHLGNDLANCGDLGLCRDNQCLVSSDCEAPENSCFTYITWWQNFCYTGCDDDGDCSAAYPNNDEFTCETLYENVLAEDIPPMDIGLCTNGTLPTLLPTGAPTEEPTAEGFNPDNADSWKSVIAIGLGFVVVSFTVV